LTGKIIQRAFGAIANIVFRVNVKYAVWVRSAPVMGIFFALLYLTIPSVTWSLVYREPKIVADVVILAIIEGLVWQPAARLIRLIWCILCVSMILLEWNIFPESYLFYIKIMLHVASFPQGRAIALGLLLLAVFIMLPSPWQPRWRRSLAVVVIYGALLGAKAWGVTKPHMTWLRQPAPRALQVAWTDAVRIGSVSVAPPHYDAQSPGHTQLAMWISATNHPVKVLVILLESWGETPADMAALIANLRRAYASAKVVGGFTDYAGPTLAGEVRDLCGRILSFSSVDASLADCLPYEAKRAGYDTTAFHGYDGYFYNRQIIYPQIGFEHSWFASDFGDLSRCGGAFDGICDDVVLEKAINQLRRPGRQFVYMMSLSAHEPISADLVNRVYLRLPSGQPLGGKQVNEALVRLAISKANETAIKTHQPVVVYLAGDHNPPGREEALGLPIGKVPYLLMSWHP